MFPPLPPDQLDPIEESEGGKAWNKRFLSNLARDYGLLHPHTPVNVVALFWALVSLGVGVAGGCLGAVLWGGEAGVMACLLGLGVNAYYAILFVFVTAAFGQALSRTAATCLGATLGVAFMASGGPEPPELGAIACGAGALIAASLTREYLAQTCDCPRLRLSVQGMLVRTACLAITLAVWTTSVER